MKLPVDERLDSILDVAPEATKSATAPSRNVVEQASDILLAEVVAESSSNTSLAPTAPAEPPATATPAALPVLLPDEQALELNADMEYARTNMKDVIDQGKAALQGILDLANDSEQPRAYEVIATMISSIVSANRELILLHKTRKDTLKTDKETKQTGEASPTEITINKAVFVGRAQDLLRSLKDIEKELDA